MARAFRWRRVSGWRWAAPADPADPAGTEAMEPPVALLAWKVDEPSVASFWPLAVFSPEWQALRWAAAGVLAEIIAHEGETVAPNALLAQIDTTGAGAGDAAPAATKEPAGQPAADEEQPKMAGKNIDVMVPTLGESVTEATVATWFKKVGDTVRQDEMLCELETDKVSVEVPAPASGVLAEILAEEGATVDAKAKLAVITEGAAGGQSADAGASDTGKAAEGKAAGGKAEPAPAPDASSTPHEHAH